MNNNNNNNITLSISAQKDIEYMPSLLSELLKLIIILMTYVPVNLIPSSYSSSSSSSSSSQHEGWKVALKRHVIHHILSGVTNTGMID